jgi:hypothetical protein
VQAEKLEIRDWRLRAEQNTMGKYTVENLIRMFEYYDQWGLVGNPNVLRWLLKRDPASLKSFVQKTLKERGAIR